MTCLAGKARSLANGHPQRHRLEARAARRGPLHGWITHGPRREVTTHKATAMSRGREGGDSRGPIRAVRAEAQDRRGLGRQSDSGGLIPVHSRHRAPTARLVSSFEVRRWRRLERLEAPPSYRPRPSPEQRPQIRGSSGGGSAASGDKLSGAANGPTESREPAQVTRCLSPRERTRR